MARHKLHHAPPSLRCPHCRGQARDLFYHSTYGTRDGPRQLWQCRLCRRRLSERRGRAFFNLKTAEVEIARSIDAMLRGDTQNQQESKSLTFLIERNMVSAHYPMDSLADESLPLVDRKHS